jgi:hypothetical protein
MIIAWVIVIYDSGFLFRADKFRLDHTYCLNGRGPVLFDDIYLVRIYVAGLCLVSPDFVLWCQCVCCPIFF